MKEPKLCQLFIYTKKAGIPSEHIKLLRQAGFLPVRVESFDEIKLQQIEPVFVGDSLQIIESLFEAMQQSRIAPWDLFAQRLVQKLRNQIQASQRKADAP